MSAEIITVQPDQAGQTLAAMLRQRLPGQSWTQVRQLVAARRVRINGELWLDAARRLKAGDKVELTDQSAPKPRTFESIRIRYVDTHVVVVEKPAGVSTVRHPTEREWSQQRRQLNPTLEDLVTWQLRNKEQPAQGPRARLRIVHRLDKETSGLLVFARTVEAERGLGKQFKMHTVTRRYQAIVHGAVEPQRIESWLVRDRGDGRRGSTTVVALGKRAVTHVEVAEKFNDCTLVICQLETGRTHQIRIHLAELGHPVCGERVYNRKPGQPPIADESSAPRLALHAAELGFQHPTTGAAMHWDMPMPDDLHKLVAKLRRGTGD